MTRRSWCEPDHNLEILGRKSGLLNNNTYMLFFLAWVGAVSFPNLLPLFLPFEEPAPCVKPAPFLEPVSLEVPMLFWLKNQDNKALRLDSITEIKK